LSDQLLSELIKRARESNNLTQTAFGKFFEPSIAQSTIARWEKGDLFPNRKHFPKIASLLNITLEEFLELISKQLSQEGIICPGMDDEIYIPNKRHFNILNKGVKSWNRWREKNYRAIPQLAGVKPKENYLDGIDLSYADLRGAFFEKKSLRDTELTRANLSGADLSGADLSNSNLFHANLTKANLTRTNLSNANLSGVNLSEAILFDATLYEANFKDANLGYADLTHADMRGANLNQANFEYAILKYCFVYGISDWNTNLNGSVQKQLSVCPNKIDPIYVDCLENARLKLLEINSHEESEIFKLANKLQTAISEKNSSFKDKLNKLHDLKGVDNDT
ncbi:MAG: pentapeptide repeat-containing protein, partial [Waterburya sp.]